MYQKYNYFSQISHEQFINHLKNLSENMFKMSNGHLICKYNILTIDLKEAWCSGDRFNNVLLTTEYIHLLISLHKTTCEWINKSLDL